MISMEADYSRATGWKSMLSTAGVFGKSVNETY